MEIYKNFDTGSRHACFINKYPEQALELIQWGEPVRFSTLYELYYLNHCLVDKILQMDFEVYTYQQTPADKVYSDADAIYWLMNRIYGKDNTKRKVLQSINLWRNFLRLVDMSENETRQCFMKYLKREGMDKALSFVAYAEKKCILSERVQQDVLAFCMDNRPKYNPKVLYYLCDFDFLAQYDFWSYDLIILFLTGCQDEKQKLKIITKIILHKEGAEILKNIAEFNCDIKRLMVENKILF